MERDRWRQYPLGTPNFGRLAQLVERFRDMKEVRGSSPLAATNSPGLPPTRKRDLGSGGLLCPLTNEKYKVL